MSAQPEFDPELHLRKFQKELSAGTVSLALLAVLGEAVEPMYGYQIAKRLEQLEGVLSGKQSALYPVLRGLEGAGLLGSHVEPSVSGPPRRYYRINDAGRAVLAQWADAWRATRDSVDAVLGPLAVSASPPASDPNPNDPSASRGDHA